MSIISIRAIVDVVAVLSNNFLEENGHLMDTNKLNGSRNEGTFLLETAVKKGDELIWSAYGLEVESYVEISDIKVNKNFLKEPVKEFYEGTNISYWKSTVIKAPKNTVSYSIDFYVGNKKTIFSTNEGPSIKPITID